MNSLAPARSRPRRWCKWRRLPSPRSRSRSRRSPISARASGDGCGSRRTAQLALGRVFRAGARMASIEIVPHPRDPDPSALLGNIPASVSHRGAGRAADDPARLAGARPRPRRPARQRRVRAGVVAARRSTSLAAELRRVYAAHGPRAVFGGSYGWASAGRFHDAQHQLHRFLNLAGGYVRSVNSYSSGAASVILPHVIGPQGTVAGNNVSWDELVADSALVLAFGGMALKNNDVGGGGTSQHIARARLRAARRRGVEFHLIGPLRDDLPAEVEAVWHPIRPGTDVALMLGLAHTLVSRGTARPRFSRPLLRRLGRIRGAICSAARRAAEGRRLGRRDLRHAGRRDRRAGAARRRPAHADHLLAIAAARRAWRAAGLDGRVLAAMLGQIGLPGGGFAYALGSTSNTGKPPLAVPLPTLPTGRNSIADFIPVARIADMLLHPGEPFDYNGQRLAYPDIRLVYWAGGNPFHHHQDLNRLRRAFCPPGHGHRARIGLDRDRAARRHRAAGDDHAGARGHRRLGRRPAAGGDAPGRRALCARRATTTRSLPGWPSGSALPSAFTEGRSPREWLRTHLRADPPRAGRARDQRARFRRVLGGRRVGPADPAVGRRPRPRIPPRPRCGAVADAERQDRDHLGDDRRVRLSRLPRPSDLAAAGRSAGSPAAARFPLQLIANQPATRLHSQLDFGATSLAVENRRPRAGAPPSRGRRRARHRATATSSAFTTIAAPALPARC